MLHGDGEMNRFGSRAARTVIAVYNMTSFSIFCWVSIVFICFHFEFRFTEYQYEYILVM